MPDRQWGYYPAAKGEALAVELERALESSPPQEQAANGTIDTASDFSSEHRGGIMPVSSTPAVRSEEHTSELQSLMRISYAVFCLKKKKIQTRTTHTTSNTITNNE